MKPLSLIATLGLTGAIMLSGYSNQAVAVEGSAQKYAVPYVTDCYSESSHKYVCFVETQGKKLLREDVESMLPNFGSAVQIVMLEGGALVYEGYGRNRITTHLLVAEQHALQRTTPVVMCGGVLVRVIDCPDHLVGTVS